MNELYPWIPEYFREPPLPDLGQEVLHRGISRGRPYPLRLTQYVISCFARLLTPRYQPGTRPAPHIIGGKGHSIGRSGKPGENPGEYFVGIPMENYHCLSYARTRVHPCVNVLIISPTIFDTYRTMNALALLRQHKPVLKNKFGVGKIGIFGSFARY